MIEAIQEFLSVALEAIPAELDALAPALDRLALAYSETPAGAPSEREEASPERDHTSLQHRIVARFPALGFYAVADPLTVPPDPPTLGDAIDDIADIVIDLSEVLWRSATMGTDDARWYFKFSYESHWGRHLHELRSYIHALQFYSLN
jgi:hypothetical protein